MVSVRLATIAGGLLVVLLCTCPATAQSNAADALFLQVVALFTKNGCPLVPSQCSAKFQIAGSQSRPDCMKVRQSGQCMFNECSDIRDTGDDTAAAGLLVQYANTYFNCTLSQDEVLRNAGVGGLQRPVWESLGMFLIASLVMVLKI